MFHKEDGRRLISFELNLLPHTQRSGEFAVATVVGHNPPLVIIRWSLLALSFHLFLKIEGAVWLILELSDGNVCVVV